MTLTKGNNDMIKAYMQDAYTALMGVLVNGETSFFSNRSPPLQRTGICASKIFKKMVTRKIKGEKGKRIGR